MKKRILYIATFPPPIHGSSVVSQQIKNSSVLQNAFEGDYINLSTSVKMSEIGKTTPIKFYRIIKSLLKTFWLLLTRKYDLCYCAITINGYCFLRDSLYVILCKLFRNRVIIHQHNKGVIEYKDKIVYRWLYKIVYTDSIVILLSEFLYNDIASFVPKQNVCICPNGVRQTSECKPRFKLNDTSKVNKILFLSNLIPSKGVYDLLEACELLREHGYEFHCYFIGGETVEISANTFNSEIIKRNLCNYVSYLGKKYGEEKDKYWKNSDIFVLPTYYHNECFPLVLLEAMAQGKPCISTNEGGISDIIDEGITGFIVEKNNSTDLASKIEILLKNEELRVDMSKNSYIKYKNKYTEEIFIENIYEIFTQTLKT